MTPQPPMTLRSLRERIVQTLTFEVLGLLIVAPLCAYLTGRDLSQTALLVAVVAALVMVWMLAYNAVFDRIEWRLTARPASDRPHRLRLLHAALQEIGSMVLTVPAIALIGGHGFWAALAVDLGLTAFYTVYAYLFYLAWDRMRPLRMAPDAALPVVTL